MQVKVTPFQPRTSFIFPPHVLHFIQVVYLESNLKSKPEVNLNSYGIIYTIVSSGVAAGFSLRFIKTTKTLMSLRLIKENENIV